MLYRRSQKLVGFIYFESIIFAVGTSVFILALVKERNEAAGMTAGRTDALTGIANRASFLESAGRVLERCRRDSAPVSGDDVRPRSVQGCQRSTRPCGW